MSLPPPPPPLRGRLSPPSLVDDAMREIFLRFPPDDTRSLVRASAVCKSWRGILSDDDFERLYRAFHGTPPMLGFLHNERYSSDRRPYEDYWISHFVSTASYSPLACEDRRHWQVLNSRHGLVLFYTPKENGDLAICDLVTRDQWEIHANPDCWHIVRRNELDGVDMMPISWNAAVLCAKDECDHLHCHGGPFLVAFVGSDKTHGTTLASVYSSETGEWSDMISTEQPDAIEVEATGHCAVVGKKVYFPCKRNNRIIEYNLGEQELSVIYVPFLPKIANVLVGVDDGMLLFATLRKHRLYLLSMGACPNGAEAWVRRRVIKLERRLHPGALLDVSVVGFAEGVRIIFLSTEYGLYTIELNSGEINSLHGEKVFKKVIPYMSFYTGAWGRLPAADEASHAVAGATTI